MNGAGLARPAALAGAQADHARAAVVRPLDLWWAALASTLIPVSLIWDFSWESTIGVDRFWSPPHLATHIGVWLSGLLGARLIIAFTLARHSGIAAPGVNVLGLCGPSGAWLLLWGAAVVQAALLLDNWWQQAYGLGAGLWPPPQILKTSGFFCALCGGALLCAAVRTNSAAAPARTANALLIWQGGLLVTMCAVVLTMKNYPNWHHTGAFYKIASAVYPGVLLAVSSALPGRWGTTLASLAYTAISCAMVWLLPLFPAQPLTPPIHNPTDHMMPPPFPLLLVAPAFVMDLLRARIDSSLSPNGGEGARRAGEGVRLIVRQSMRAIALGTCFVAAFLPAQWFFANFLLSPAADNWFFAGAGRHWPFFLKIDQARIMFWGVQQDPVTWRVMALAVLIASASAGLGIQTGRWLANLRR